MQGNEKFSLGPAKESQSKTLVEGWMKLMHINSEEEGKEGLKSHQFKHIAYADLSAPQKESYNYHKIAARLADYGFNCIPLNDDWLGADFIASHVDGKTFLKVQQKARFEVNKKYCEKNLYMAFRSGEDVYIYPHDLMMEKLVKWGTEKGRLVNTQSWKDGGFSWKNLTKEHLALLLPYKF